MKKVLFFLTLTLTCIRLSVVCQERQEYQAKIGNIKDFMVKKNTLIAQQGIVAQVRINNEHWESIEVISFSATIIRMDSCLSIFHNEGSKFDGRLIVLLKQLRKSDTILFHGICCKLAGGEMIFLQPLECKLQ